MATVSGHHENLLAPIYSWMGGAVENAFTQGALDLESWMPSGAVAVDLGAGFRKHTVPLARAAIRLSLSTGIQNASAQALYEKAGWRRDTDFYVYHCQVSAPTL